MKFNTIEDAEEKGLVQLTHWLFDSPAERAVLEGFHDQVMKNTHRIAIYVRCRLGSRIALFVNDVTIKEKYYKGGDK